MNSHDLKRIIIWVACIIVLFYWMVFLFLDKRLEGMFELAITLLITEKGIELWEYVYNFLEEKINEPL